MTRSVGDLARVIQETSLYALWFLLPFSKAAVEIAFGGLLVGWVLERLDPRTRAESLWGSSRLRPLLLSLAAYLGICALSVLVSRYPALSLRAFFSKWLEYAFLMVITADVCRRPRVVRQSLAVVGLSALFVLVEGVTQERFGNGLFRGYRLDFFDRMTGPYENPIDLATYLMVVIPILLAHAAWHRRALPRAALLALTGLLLLSLGRTMALGAWVGLAAGLVGILLVGDAAFRRWGLALLVAAAVGCGWFILRAGALGGTLPLFSASVNREAPRHEVSFSEIGVSDRWFMWQAAIGMIRDRPVLGHGLNTFMAHYLDYWVGGQRLPRYAHNCYLQVAAETGILGLAAFLWLLGALGARVFRALRGLPSKGRLLLSGVCAGLLAFAVQAGFDTNFYSLRQAVLFWTLAGLALGMSEGSWRAAPPPASSSGR